MAEEKSGAGLALLGRAFAQTQSAATEIAGAQADVEAVVQRFREDPSAWKELGTRLQGAANDEERASILVDFAVSPDGLRRVMPGSAERAKPVAATPTVTTVTVTTVTTV